MDRMQLSIFISTQNALWNKYNRYCMQSVSCCRPLHTTQCCCCDNLVVSCCVMYSQCPIARRIRGSGGKSDEKSGSGRTCVGGK